GGSCERPWTTHRVLWKCRMRRGVLRRKRRRHLCPRTSPPCRHPPHRKAPKQSPLHSTGRARTWLSHVTGARGERNTSPFFAKVAPAEKSKPATETLPFLKHFALNRLHRSGHFTR